MLLPQAHISSFAAGVRTPLFGLARLQHPIRSAPGQQPATAGLEQRAGGKRLSASRPDWRELISQNPSCVTAVRDSAWCAGESGLGWKHQPCCWQLPDGSSNGAGRTLHWLWGEVVNCCVSSGIMFLPSSVMWMDCKRCTVSLSVSQCKNDLSPFFFFVASSISSPAATSSPSSNNSDLLFSYPSQALWSI